MTQTRKSGKTDIVRNSLKSKENGGGHTKPDYSKNIYHKEGIESKPLS